jgi:hypothetical protein
MWVAKVVVTEVGKSNKLRAKLFCLSLAASVI